MNIELTRSKIELIERSLRFFFCQCDNPKLEDKTDKAFDLAIEFENLLNRNEKDIYEIFTIC